MFRRRMSAWVVAGLAWVLAGSLAWGSGPRYVTGPPFFTGPAGVPVGWRQTQLLYYTDPADLSTTVNHAAADALVAAAAGVWNVSVANITVSQGGELAEHVSGSNVYLSNDGMVWPSDVMSTNAAAIPVAVVYDADGSVTDTLLGAGASSPSSCRQNAVTETVDSFDPAGYILHAIVVVNGLCTGAAAAQQLQLQYQLERIFGRILGLAWSQNNDNVFTGTPTPTYDQATHWPIMHPIDILCGTYTYQCLPNPFQLRDDDVAGLVGLYPIKSGTPVGAGKQVSLANASSAYGTLSFPDGEGMTGVNALLYTRPRFTFSPNDWSDVSGVTGSLFRLAGTSPFVASDSSAMGSLGTLGTNDRGYFSLPYIAIPIGSSYNSQDEFFTLEPINPLYIGPQSVGPYRLGMVAPAGTLPTSFLASAVGAGQNQGEVFPVSDAPSTCGSGSDGTAADPVASAATGWWDGQLCGYGHAAYFWLALKAGHSLTIEATGLDANGFATMTKAMPSIGLFAMSDLPSGLPSLGLQEAAFNGLGVGTTTLSATPFAAGGPGGEVVVGIADERGEGRPDFSYQTRVFYADSVVPSVVSSSGGATSLTISGMGFRAGNHVLVNGVAATVTSWTSNRIVATVPTMAQAGATSGSAVDVEVLDVGTGATSTISGGLTYSGGAVPNAMELVSAPQGFASTGSVASPPFVVQVVKADGVTPVVGDTVVFTVAAGSAQFSVCGAATCSVTTGSNGQASSGVVPGGAGTITIKATDGSSSQSVTFVGQTAAASMVVKNAPSGSLPVGHQANNTFQVQILNSGGSGIAGQLVTFQVTAGSATFAGCNASVCSALTDGQGEAYVWVTPTGAGAITLRANVGSVSQSISFTATASQDILTLASAPSTPQLIGAAPWNVVAMLTLGDGVTPVGNIPLVFSGSPGVVFQECNANPCTVYTATWNGQSSVHGAPLVPGTETITVTYGSLSVSTTITVVQPVPTLKLISAPSGNVPIGSPASVPVVAQWLDEWGNPEVNQQMILGGPLNQTYMGSCNYEPSCILFTDANGEVRSTVTALFAGPMVVEAVAGNLVAQAQFTAVGGVETLTVISAPPPTVPVGTPITMKVLGVSPDGVTPEAWATAWLTVTTGNLSIPSCELGFCKYSLGPDGTLTVTATGWIPGPIVVSIVVDGITVVISFTVVSQGASMALVSAPSGNYPSGVAITPPFVVQMLGPDGKTGLSGQNVTFSVSNGSATLGACPSLPCLVTTNASGIASSGTVGAVGTGAVTLLASDNGMKQTASYTVLPKPDVVSLESAPTSVSQGATTTQPFGVQVMLADGVTPAAGVTVTLKAIAGTGAATLSACGTPSCSVTTNANGLASSTVTGTQVGSVTLSGTATLATGNQTVTAPLTVVASVKTVTGTPPKTYVAEAATFSGSISLSAVQNGSAATGQAVVWTGTAGYAVAATSGTTDGNGNAKVSATLGPLAAGASAQATGCVWQTVCATYQAQGVSAKVWAVAVVSGGNQSVSGGAAMAPVVAQVTDGAGHPVVGAVVSVGQTVRALDAQCPVQGRCPAAPVLASSSSTLTTDGNGEVSVAPLGVSGTATQTSLDFSAGLQGFATAVVSSTP